MLREGQAQGLELSVVVKDAAKWDCRGGERGVSQRGRAARRLLSCALRDAQVRRRLERRAYAAIEREGEALGRLGKIRACDKARRRKAKHALRRARRECAEAIERFDEFEAAMDTLRGALECVDIHTGELHRPEHVQALIVCRKKEDRAASRQRRFFSGRSAPPMRMQPRISPIACTTFAPTRGGTPVRRHPITA